jgi:hypothetical protein
MLELQGNTTATLVLPLRLRHSGAHIMCLGIKAPLSLSRQTWCNCVPVAHGAITTAAPCCVELSFTVRHRLRSASAALMRPSKSYLNLWAADETPARSAGSVVS